MMTPSHLLMTAGLLKAAKVSRKYASAAMWGSVAPDLPLYFLSIGGMWYFQQAKGMTASETGRHIYGTLFFQDPGWIVLHNLLHAPLVLAFAFAAIWLLRRRGVDVSRRWTWFFCAAALHCFVDLFTHVDDGPLIYFPFDWQTRFAAPVSYWDPRHHGRTFARIELILNVALLMYLTIGPLTRLLLARFASSRRGLGESAAVEEAL